MFGRLRLDRHRLSSEQRADYRAHFCGACHALARHTGRASACLTNYEQAALALLFGALQQDARVDRAPCTALPLRRVGVRRFEPAAAALLAAANVQAVVAKLRDDVDDEGGLRLRARGLAAWLGLQGSRPWASRAARLLRGVGFPVERFEQLPARQRAAEREARDLDALAAPSVELGALVFGHAAELAGRADCRSAAERLGAALADYVYVLDAVEDLDEDARRGRFNALRAVDVVDALPVQSRLLGRVAAAEVALAELPAGPSRDLLAELLASMRGRAGRSVRRHLTLAEASLRELRPAEAGDCDVCVVTECCSLGECGALDCCVKGDAVGAAGTGCDAAAWGCDALCCFGDREERRKRRAERRSRRRAAEP